MLSYFVGICGLLQNKLSIDPWASLVAQWERIRLQKMQEVRDPWVGKVPWRGKLTPTPVFLLEKSQGKRSLLGNSPWGRKRVRQDLATKQQL